MTTKIENLDTFGFRHISVLLRKALENGSLTVKNGSMPMVRHPTTVKLIVKDTFLTHSHVLIICEKGIQSKEVMTH